mmetsp:Transcript_48675/g.150317  ORF Transcript_48675/g.150317 Transcript_48675/m.150317 type:complete len:214 (+) Transcript_48675:431-1072(+)
MEHLRYHRGRIVALPEGGQVAVPPAYGHEAGPHGEARAVGQNGEDDPGLRLAAGAAGVHPGERGRPVLVQLPPPPDPADGGPHVAHPPRLIYERPRRARGDAPADLPLFRLLHQVHDLDVRADARQLAPDLLDAGQPREPVVRPHHPGLQGHLRLRHPDRHQRRVPARDLQGGFRRRGHDAVPEAEGHEESRQEDGDALQGGGHLVRRPHRQG